MECYTNEQMTITLINLSYVFLEGHLAELVYATSSKLVFRLKCKFKSYSGQYTCVRLQLFISENVRSEKF